MAWSDVETEPHLSASQLGMYQRCPKQYEFRYIKGLKRPPGMALVVGSSVHSGIELNYASKFKTKKQEAKDAVLDAFSTKFEELKKEADKDEPEGNSKDRGVAMLEAHYDFIAPTLQPVEMPELEFSITIPGVKRKMVGFIDIIGTPLKRDQHGAKAAKPLRVIIDNKTSKRKYQRLAVEVSTQLTSYEFAHRVVYGKKSDGVGVDVMVNTTKRGEMSTEVQRLLSVRDESEMVQFAETVRGIEKGITTGVFPPVNDAQTCSWCGYRDLCVKSAVIRAAAYKEDA